MAIEIKELVIRAVAQQGSETDEPSAAVTYSMEERAAIVEAAVKQVLRILRSEKER